MRILVAEDDPSLARFMVKALEEAGYEVDHVLDGTAGLQKAAAAEYDLLLLDVVLPGLTGFQLCDILRKNKNTTPVIFISARGALDDKVRGLDLGADDYLAKPFHLAELMARIRSSLRRVAIPSSALTCGDISVDPVRREARAGDQGLQLSPTEYSLLLYLIENQGRTVTRSAIMKHVWRQTFDGDDKVLDVYISSLRRKLGHHGRSIQTERGIGYRFSSSGSHP